MKRRSLIQALGCAAAVPGGAFAENRPLRIVVPFPPGGANDIAARALQELLQRLPDQPVVVENRAGAGGSVGMSEVARAAPDGLTVGVATLSTHGVNPAVYARLPYDPVRDFIGVTEVVKAPGVLVVNAAALPVKDCADLVRRLRAHPDAVAYASPGNGTIGHLWGELFKRSTGTDMLHIPYRGAGPALNDVLAGQTPVYFDQVAAVLPAIRSGKLQALAVSWHRRLEMLPAVPTYAELGYPQANQPSWFGLVAPAATPEASVRRLQQAVAAALAEPAVRERLAGQGLYPSGSTPAQFARQIAAEIAKMKAVAAFARIQLD